MRNYWVQKDKWMYAWTFSIDPREVSGAALAEFAVLANEVLEREQILQVEYFRHGQNLYEYRREVDGGMAQHCQRLYREQSLIQFPSGDVERGNRATSNIAYYDRKDTLVVAPVSDLGILLRDLEPTPGAILRYLRRRGHAPIEVTGAVVATSELATRSSISFHLATHSNIWAPYLYWTGHPWGPQAGVYYDNRELAQHHTTRLNRVIAALADMTAELGGTWKLSEPAQFATDRGIDLDPVLPGKLAEGAELAAWPDQFEEDGIPMVERNYEYGL